MVAEKDLIKYFQENQNQMNEEKIIANYEELKKKNDIAFISPTSDFVIKTIVALGDEQGFKQGLKQGIKQGIEQARIENAHKMIQKGYLIEEIEEITGISVKELEAWMNANENESAHSSEQK